MAMDMTALRATSQLLSEVFGPESPTSVEYLQWLYVENPNGKVRERNYDDAEGRAGHYAIVPLSLNDGERDIKIGLSLNTAVSRRAQGEGLFTRLAQEVFRDAADDYWGVVGVANANSTPGFTRKLGFTLVKALPVYIGVCAPRGDSELKEDDAALHHVAHLEEEARRGSTSASGINWTMERLSWRLRRPGANYRVFASDRIGLVASRTVRKGLAFTVILGTFGRGTHAEVKRLVGRACSAFGTWLYMYIGWNHYCPLRGTPLPPQLKPSPLNLIWRQLKSDAQMPEPSEYRRFELIEFDAY